MKFYSYVTLVTQILGKINFALEYFHECEILHEKNQTITHDSWNFLF